MNLKEKLAALSVKSASFDALIKGGTLLSAEQQTEWEATLTEMEGIAKQLEIAERAEKAAGRANEPANTLPRPVNNDQSELKARVLRTAVGCDVSRWQGETREEKAQNAYDFGMWGLHLLAGKLGALGARATAYCQERGITKAHQERDNETGGFLVPDQFINRIIDLRNAYGQFRQYTDVIPMSGETASIPRRASGLTAYWGSESAILTESTAGFDKVNLIAKKLTAYAVMSSEISEDAVIDFANRLADEIAYQFSYQEDLAGFLGDGSSTYGGIVGVAPKLKALSGTIANIAGLVVAAGNTFDEFTLANFRSVVAKLPTYARRRSARWFVHPVVYFETMVGLAESAGGVTATELIDGTRRDMFMGYPVELIEVLPSTNSNSQVCVLFGDMSLASMLGDRKRLAISTSEHVRFAYDDLVIKGVSRLDINVHSVGNASATAASRVPGPVVGLISAAA